MEIRQFVMACGAEQDRLRAVLPEGYSSLRPVLRINAGIRDNTDYLEYNTAVEREDVRGWLNIGSWENIPFTVENAALIPCEQVLGAYTVRFFR